MVGLRRSACGLCHSYYHFLQCVGSLSPSGNITPQTATPFHGYTNIHRHQQAATPLQDVGYKGGILLEFIGLALGHTLHGFKESGSL